MSKPPFSLTIPEGDTKERLVCGDCGHIAYENPKIVVGSIAVYENKVLLCRRAIEPQKGLWTLPAGYMELDETSEEAAVREAIEEADADIEITGLLGVFNLPHVNQVQLIYKAKLLDDHIAAGDETSEVKLFSWNNIPWQELAFPTVEMALHYWHSTKNDDDNKIPTLRAISNVNVEGV